MSSFFQWLFGVEAPDNAIIDLRELFLKKDIFRITTKDIGVIEATYNFNVLKKYRKEILRIYSNYYVTYLDNGYDDQTCFDSLEKFKDLFYFQESDYKEIEKETIVEYHKNLVHNLVEDPINFQDNLSVLNKRLFEFGYSEELASRNVKNYLSNFTSLRFREITKDFCLSPSDWEDYKYLLRQLDINLIENHEVTTEIDKFINYWKLGNASLPVVHTTLNLSNKEYCIFKFQSTWQEVRSITTGIRYGGLTGRVRIAKGLSYRVGSMSYQRVTHNDLINIDYGTLYLTNQRWLFVGAHRTGNCNWNKVLSVFPYSDAIEFVKDRGRNQYFSYPPDIDIFVLLIILSRLLNNSTVNIRTIVQNAGYKIPTLANE